MELKAGSQLHGFTVRYVKELPEIKATLYRMEYDKNGADLVWVKRADENKTFAIGFKTIPQDDTGVFHILEHSVLNGSQKYPVKEPFVELLKSSLQTFLNAMTYPDKTVYPVSSRNNQDFLNLMDVYLDATLHPLCAVDPHAYRQEGWHYEMDSPEGELTCNGVVLNEMKGAYADPDTVLMAELNRLMYPDNCYRFESGGAPEHIPELTYEEYQASRARFYHPSNARVVLDGAVDLDAALAKLDEYFAPFERIDPKADIPMQAPVAPPESTISYEIGQEEDEADKVILAGAWMYGTYQDKEMGIVAQLLSQLLCGSNEAPLTKAILEEGLAQDVSIYPMDGMQQNYMALVVRNTSMEKKNRVWQVFEETVSRLAKEGLDRERIHSILNRMEFTYRERDFGGMPKGLVLGLNTYNTWLYGGAPEDSLCFNETFAALREKIDQGWFEKILEDVLLHNSHKARLCMQPSKTIGAENRAKEAARLAEVKAGWDDAKIADVMELFAELRQRQATPDSPEQLATLPKLDLRDIPEKASEMKSTVGSIAGRTLLHQDVDTDGITYLSLYFDCSDLPIEELTKTTTMAGDLGELGTEHYDPLALHSLIEGRLGRFHVENNVSAHAGDLKNCLPQVVVSLGILEGSKADAREILREVLQTSQFDPAQTYNLLRQERIMQEQQMIGRGNSTAAGRAQACLSASGAVGEALAGITHLRWVQAAEKAFPTKGEAICADLASLCKRIFTRDRITVCVTGPLDEAWITGILEDFPAGAPGPKAVYQPLENVATGIQIPAEVGFAAKCTNAYTVTDTLPGAARVAANILTYSYLWNEVRVKGGAYGTGFRANRDGDLSFSSFRDPNCGQTLETFSRAPDALRAIVQSGEKLDSFIISTIGDLEPLYTPRMLGIRAAMMYFSGQTQEDVQTTRTQVLHTTGKDLMDVADLLDRTAPGAAICVVGGKSALDGCGDKLVKRENLQ